MFPIEIQIKRADLPDRNHGRLMKAINRGFMERQARDRLPNHFEEFAYSEYNARPRTAKYNEYKRKNKRIGHTRPNVKTGRLRRSVLSRVKITATQHGSKLIMTGSVRSPLQDWQKREIAVVSERERAKERKRMASEYKRGATSDKYKRKRKRSIK